MHTLSTQLTSLKLTEDGEEPVLETDDRVVELQKRKSVEEGRSDVKTEPASKHFVSS